MIYDFDEFLATAYSSLGAPSRRTPSRINW